MRALRLVLPIVLAALAVVPVRAETLTTGRDLDAESPMGKYLLSMDFYKRMHAIAVEADRVLGVRCDTRYEIRPLSVIVFKPVELPTGALHATGGIWAYRFDANRCGTTKRYNLMMTSQPGAAPRAAMMVPGDTITSPLLARDTIRSVAAKASIALDGKCEKVQIFDTAVAEQPHAVTQGGTTYQGVWKEIWTFQGCGQRVPVPVIFVPDGKGGTNFFTED